MSAVVETLELCKQEGKKAFVAYVTAGDPCLETTVDVVQSLVENGADIIELGVPFSDPIADGPTNQRAAQRALSRDTTLEGIFDAVQSIRDRGIKAPIILFSYANPLLQMGYKEVVSRAIQVGVDGFLVVDLPPGEQSDYHDAMKDGNLSAIFLASPLTDTQRLEVINSHSKGFVYYVSRTGVTGVQQDISETLADELSHAKKHVSLPLMVGFGISTPDQAIAVARCADGIVIGSALVNLIEKNQDKTKLLSSLADYTISIRKALDSVPSDC